MTTSDAASSASGEPRELRDERRPLHEPGARRGETAGEPARRPGAGEVSHVDAEPLAIAVGERLEPRFEPRDRVGRRALSAARRCGPRPRRWS